MHMTNRNTLTLRQADQARTDFALLERGGAKLRSTEILYRAVLLPLSEDGATIDHVLGAVSYHPLPAEDALTPQVILQTYWF